MQDNTLNKLLNYFSVMTMIPHTNSYTFLVGMFGAPQAGNGNFNAGNFATAAQPNPATAQPFNYNFSAQGKLHIMLFLPYP